MTITLYFVPSMSSTNIPDLAPCLNKDSGIRLGVRSYALRNKLNSVGLDIIFRLFKCVLSGARVTRSLVLYVCFIDR
jgi:hypothetical protein